MKLKLSHIKGKGGIDTERLVIKVLNNTDLGNYVLMRAPFTDDEVTTKVENTFWFPYKKVQAGDLVVIYSKRGNQNEKTLDSGNTSHFFYWNQPEAQWSSSKTGAVILFAPIWEAESTENLSDID